MKGNLMKCDKCGDLFNPAFLDQVVFHEHKEGLELKQVIKGMQIEKFWPSSKNVARTKYYPEKEIVEVEFVNSKTYHYSKVPVSVWKQLLEATSIGTFLNDHIKGVFGFVQI